MHYYLVARLIFGGTMAVRDLWHNRGLQECRENASSNLDLAAGLLAEHLVPKDLLPQRISKNRCRVLDGGGCSRFGLSVFGYGHPKRAVQCD